MHGDKPKLSVVSSSPVEFDWVGDDPGAPLPLVGDSLVHPYAFTLMYGRPSIGKGMLALHAIRSLISEGYNPVVFDWEANLWEWRQRAFATGLRFPVYSPTHRLNMLDALQLGEAVAHHGFTHCFVDSASRAAPRGKANDFGGTESTVDFFGALAQIGIPTFIIAHEGKSENGPLGSTHWTSVPRLVFHGTSPKYGQLRVVCEKYSDGDKTKYHGSFTISAHGNAINIVRDKIEVVMPDKQISQDERILAIMLPTLWYTAKEVADRVNIDGGTEISEDVARSVLSRLMGKGLVNRVGRGKYVKAEPNLT